MHEHIRRGRRRVPSFGSSRRNRRVRGKRGYVAVKSIFRMLTTAMFLAGSVFLLNWLSDPRNMPIEQVKIEGKFRYLSPERLKRMIAEDVRGGFFYLNVEAVRAAVLSEAWARDVSVQRIWHNQLRIVVREQQPVARWGNYGYLNSAGNYFEPDDYHEIGGLVQLRGPQGREKQVLALCRDLERRLSEFGRRLQWLSLSSRRSWSFGLVNGPVVIVGQTDVENRLALFFRDVERVLGAELDQLHLVDMRYTNGFSVLPKMKSTPMWVKEPLADG